MLKKFTITLQEMYDDIIVKKGRYFNVIPFLSYRSCDPLRKILCFRRWW